MNDLYEVVLSDRGNQLDRYKGRRSLIDAAPVSLSVTTEMIALGRLHVRRLAHSADDADALTRRARRPSAFAHGRG